MTKTTLVGLVLMLCGCAMAAKKPETVDISGVSFCAEPVRTPASLYLDVKYSEAISGAIVDCDRSIPPLSGAPAIKVLPSAPADSLQAGFIVLKTKDAASVDDALPWYAGFLGSNVLVPDNDHPLAKRGYVVYDAYFCC